MINAAVMGAIWGLLRVLSGSVIVASVSHGIWNGGAYVFFGFGTKIGALGIKSTAIYGPEVGFLGLVLNLILCVAIWRWWKIKAPPDTSLSGAKRPLVQEVSWCVSPGTLHPPGSRLGHWWQLTALESGPCPAPAIWTL